MDRRNEDEGEQPYVPSKHQKIDVAIDSVEHLDVVHSSRVTAADAPTIGKQRILDWTSTLR